MVHVLVVFGALWLTLRLLQWGELFCLDELPEFNRSVLEVMRQPLEDRATSTSKAKYSIEHSALFHAGGADNMRLYPCGRGI